jgi:hypothetical protein
LTLSAGELVALVQSTVWPLTILILLILYRKEVPRLAERVAGRVSRVSFASVSLELAVATEIAPEIWQSLRDLRDTTPGPQIQDTGGFLFQLIQGGERADFVKIDLGEGDRWLTSRLFLFALIPFQLLRVQTLVFLETRDGLASRFAGLASPASVRAALGVRYPWFEAAWITAQLNYASLSEDAVNAFAVSIKQQLEPGPLKYWNLAPAVPGVVQQAYQPANLSDPQTADRLARTWRADPSIYREVPSFGVAEDSWVRLGRTRKDPTMVREERAEWITSGAVLDRMLRGALLRSRVVDSGPITRRELYRQAVLQWDTDFVAVVDGDGLFKQLLDRRAITTGIAIDQADRQPVS